MEYKLCNMTNNATYTASNAKRTAKRRRDWILQRIDEKRANGLDVELLKFIEFVADELGWEL